ncbi:MAG: hypothetical protein L0220_30095 [Acidobacteria bacterium]|nr:hypothetical protein [Acidobacteriota bacterium]
MIESLSDEEKRQAKRSLEYLSGILGEDFLTRAVNIGHPLKFPVMVATAWTRLWLIDLAEALAALSSAENFHVVLSKIRADNQKETARKQFGEGLSVLEAAYRFFKAGFDIAFDQKELVTLLNGKRHEKKPDLKITDGETGETLFAEVSNLEMSEAHSEAQRISWPLYTFDINEVLGAGMVMYAEMREGFNENDVPNILAKLRELSADVKSHGQLRELVSEKIIAGIAPKEAEDSLKRWAGCKGISPGLAGPPFVNREIERLAGKIWDKLAQLPETKPGAIIIPVRTGNTLFLSYPPEVIAQALEQKVKSYPHLLFVALSQSWLDLGGGDSSVVNIGQHTMVSEIKAQVHKSQTLILLNDACTAPLDNKTRQKAIAAFGGLA